ncbi:MAG TPA: rhomboid family intramembrane serine protease [Mycobacteriales bacterium]|nr:rhomboid family intramembrane serine protease [Mycobacteriales bacterium]
MSEQETGTADTSAVPVCYRHPRRETYVRCVRCDRPICPDCMNAASVGHQCPDCVHEGSRSVRRGQTVFGGDTAGERGQVTRSLIAVNVAMWLLTVVTVVLSGAYRPAELGQLIAYGGSSPVTNWGAVVDLFRYTDGSYGGVAAGEYYRLLTAGFLHYGLLHLALNMYALWLLGRECERLLGRWRFLALYLLAGVGGATAVYLFAPNTATVGASGSIFGLIGALFFFFRRMKADVRGLLGLLALNLVITFWVPGISIMGHLGGLAAGAAIGATFAYAPRKGRLAVQLGGLALVALLLVLAVIWRTGQLTG